MTGFVFVLKAVNLSKAFAAKWSQKFALQSFARVVIFYFFASLSKFKVLRFFVSKTFMEVASLESLIGRP